MKKSDILDVSKGNGLAPITIILSAPLLAVSMILLLLYALIASIAVIIGRRAAFNVLYTFQKEVLDL